MKIKNIEIDNFRGIQHLSIDLHDNLNVLIGTNGAGKTTILDAISIALSWLVNRIQRQSSSGSPIADNDIRNSEPFSSIKITCEEDSHQHSWKLVKGAKGRSNELKSELIEVADLAFHFQKCLEINNELPVIAYYPVDRVVNNTTPSLKESDIIDVYDDALGGKQNFQSFFEWFRLQDDIVNETAMSRTKWINQNKVSLKRQTRNIIFLIEETLYKERITDTEKITFFKERLLYDEFIYQEPRYFFYEVSKLLNYSNQELKSKHVSVLANLEFMIHKMEGLMYSIEHQDYLVDARAMYEDLIYKTIKDFELEKRDLDKTDIIIQEILWELFIFANTLSLWWISEAGRKRIEKYLRSNSPLINNGRNDWHYVFDELIDSISQTIKREIQKKRNASFNYGRELKIVTEAIEKFVPEYSYLRVKRVPRPHMLINKGEEEFNLNQLSAGEKNLITLIGDIARRLAIANPQSPTPLSGDGIILIDEIDLHLHPSWQRRLIPHLQNTFPNCQFIITTHSPQVISNTKPEGLFLLEQSNNILQYRKITEVYGMSIERVVELIMNDIARPSEVQIDLEMLFEHIERKSLEKANILLNKLKVYMKTDPEVMRAELLIRKAELNK